MGKFTAEFSTDAVRALSVLTGTQTYRLFGKFPGEMGNLKG
jgi:hypothetical protein